VQNREQGARVIEEQDAVEKALSPTGSPKNGVILETVVVTHGLPAPHNLGSAAEMSEAVTRGGGRPLFTGFVRGTLRVGMTAEELRGLASRPDVIKAQARDIPLCASRGLCAGTTVSAALAIAEHVGVEVVVTGGIGGVHRGYETSLDVSADLPEFARRSAVVVSAGAKSLMDLEKTLEYLETLGVPVVGYQTSEFPAFYSRESGLRLEHRVDSPEEAVAFYRAMKRYGLSRSMLLCVPVPEEDSMAAAEVDRIVSEAHERAAALGIKGKALTPFLLTAMGIISDGRTVRCNLSLLRSNAYVAGRMAAMLSRSA
jgi:pseudouridine-5'-phosphate glycosidase